jgi:hypothetical protein
MTRLSIPPGEDFASIEAQDGSIRVAVRTAIANVVSLLKFPARPIRMLRLQCPCCGGELTIKVYADDRLTIEGHGPAEEER